MSWDQIEGNWKQIKGKAREQWGKITDDQLDVIAGKRDQLAGKIQERYGITKEQTEHQLNVWLSKMKTELTTCDKPKVSSEKTVTISVKNET